MVEVKKPDVEDHCNKINCKHRARALQIVCSFLWVRILSTGFYLEDMKREVGQNMLLAILPEQYCDFSCISVNKYSLNDFVMQCVSFPRNMISHNWPVCNMNV